MGKGRKAEKGKREGEDQRKEKKTLLPKGKGKKGKKTWTRKGTPLKNNWERKTKRKKEEQQEL